MAKLARKTFSDGESQDHAGLLRYPEFLGILIQEHLNHSQAITAYESLKAALENSVRLIDLELRN